MYLESKEFETPAIEVSIKLIIDKQDYELGTYSLIFDENFEQIDEVLNLD